MTYTRIFIVFNFYLNIKNYETQTKKNNSLVIQIEILTFKNMVIIQLTSIDVQVKLVGFRRVYN